jgi:uncharacterized protein YbjT (DUF2867 family)
MSSLPSAIKLRRRRANVILVTGATGTVGGELVQQLADQAETVRVFMRDPGKADRFNGRAQIAVGDLDEPESVDAALHGVRSIFLVTGRTEQDATVLEAAARRGVEHIVKLSTLEASDDSMSDHVRWHRRREQLIEASGLAWTFLRPTMFMSTALDWAGSIRARGCVEYPGGEGRVPPVDPFDVAAVAAVALTRAGHEGQAYALTGPEALTMGEMTRILSEALDMPIRYVDVPEAEFALQLREQGLPDYVADGLVGVFSAIRAGKLADVSDEVMRVTGRPARTFEAWCRNHRDAFRG